MSSIAFKSTIILFGSTGDLSQRKLFPSMFHLFQEQSLQSDFVIIAVGRRDYDDESFRLWVKSVLENNDKLNHLDGLDQFLSHIFYAKVDLNLPKDYIGLNDKIKELEVRFNTEGNRLFYLAVSPDFFITITHNLNAAKCTESSGYKRLIIEKPFGKDYDSANQLNASIGDVFDEDEIYRIDHYLGKEMVQNIEVIRFSNSLFEPLWNNLYISNIQITSSESLGVLDRGSYYDTSGAVRDMFQNHMLQIVSLLAMEPPSSLSSEDIRYEKTKVLKSIRQYDKDEVKNYFVRGQYDQGKVNGNDVVSYREEQDIPDDSNTPTFVAARLYIDNFRWAGVPFYVRTGKRMSKKETKIVVEFKEVPKNLYYNSNDKDVMGKNLLVIEVQPEEKITLYLNVKDYDSAQDTKQIGLTYKASKSSVTRTVDAYENLIFDALNGDSTNFTHESELLLAWKFVDVVNEVWEKDIAPFPNYRSGSNGPIKSQLLLSRDGFKWWDV